MGKRKDKVVLKPKTCLVCDKVFTRERKKYQDIAKYCSMECSGLDHRNRQSTKCLSCGKEFEFRTSQLNKYKGAGKFCSKDCSKNGTTKVCVICGKEISSYNDIGKYCEEHKGKHYLNFEGIEKRAFTLGGNLRIGKGKKETLIRMLTEAVDTPCRYCKTVISIKNASIDHKQPFSSSGLDRRKVKTLGERRHIDRPENLEIICKNCNTLKGDMSDIEYSTLLDFLHANPTIEKKLMKRLAQSRVMWSMKRKAR